VPLAHPADPSSKDAEQITISIERNTLHLDKIAIALGTRIFAEGWARTESVEKLAQEVQRITGDHVELAYVDQGYTGQASASAAAKHGIQLEVVKHTQAKRGFVLLPRRWVVERSFAWAARFRPLARDYERLSQTLAASHYFAFACLMLGRIFKMLN
jgi:transposase